LKAEQAWTSFEAEFLKSVHVCFVYPVVTLIEAIVKREYFIERTYMLSVVKLI